jgi:hypothetical protein
LVTWSSLPPYTRAPDRIPATSYGVDFILPVRHAINATDGDVDATSPIEIGRGKQVGTLNGQPLVAGCRLLVCGGQLVARAAHMRRVQPAWSRHEDADQPAATLSDRKHKAKPARKSSTRANGPSALPEDQVPAVEPVRLRNGTAVAAEWVDPDDLSVQRRVAKTVRGYRATLQVESLAARGTISKSQARAAMRLRNAFERGVLQSNGSTNWESIKIGFGPDDGPAAIRLQHLERYQAAAAHLVATFLSCSRSACRTKGFATLRIGTE